MSVRKAFNISQEQIAWARERARDRGLENQVEFIQADWRTIEGKFDAFVSVGMLEHAGLKNYQQLGQKIFQSLEPHGLGLIHSIGQNQPLPLSTWIERRIFPGAYPPTIRQMMDIFEPGNFLLQLLADLLGYFCPADNLGCHFHLPPF